MILVCTGCIHHSLAPLPSPSPPPPPTLTHTEYLFSCLSVCSLALQCIWWIGTRRSNISWREVMSSFWIDRQPNSVCSGHFKGIQSLKHALAHTLCILNTEWQRTCTALYFSTLLTLLHWHCKCEASVNARTTQHAQCSLSKSFSSLRQ